MINKMQIIIRLVTLFIMGSYLIIMDLSWKTSATSGVQHRENFSNDSLLPDNIRLFPPVSSSFYSNISLVQSSISYTFHQHNNIITNITQADDTHRKLFFSNKLLTKRTIKLVIYDKIRGYLNWQQDWFIQAAKDECSNDYSCELSEDQSDVSSADMILFHAPTHHNGIPSRKNKQSSSSSSLAGAKKKPIYTLISMEQPKYALILQNKKLLEESFDLLATYSLKNFYPGTSIPNLPLTYYPLHILALESILQQPKPFMHKNGYDTGVSTVLVTSNCHNAGATGRFNYVAELMALTKVHSYGKCHNNRKEPKIPEDSKWPQMAQRRARKIKILSNYKFYLAFENLSVEDYVSEKVFEGLFAGVIPIYRGTTSISQFMPSEDSYINANNLTAIELANLINRLTNDENEYNQYFAFKNRPISKSFQQIALMSYTHPNVLCRLCEYVNKQTYQNI